jgi:hypothetical protein
LKDPQLALTCDLKFEPHERYYVLNILPDTQLVCGTSIFGTRHLANTLFPEQKRNLKDTLVQTHKVQPTGAHCRGSKTFVSQV